MLCNLGKHYDSCGHNYTPFNEFLPINKIFVYYKYHVVVYVLISDNIGKRDHYKKLLTLTILSTCIVQMLAVWIFYEYVRKKQGWCPQLEKETKR